MTCTFLVQVSSVQALERRILWQWLCAPHAQVSRNILISGGQVKTNKKMRTINTGVLRLLTPIGVINTEWKSDPDVLEVLKLQTAEANNLLKGIVNIRYNRRLVVVQFAGPVSLVCLDGLGPCACIRMLKLPARWCSAA